jgi:hypothetical protein
MKPSPEISDSGAIIDLPNRRCCTAIAEETAKLVVLTCGMNVRHLDADQIAALDATFRLL